MYVLLPILYFYRRFILIRPYLEEERKNSEDEVQEVGDWVTWLYLYTPRNTVKVSARLLR